MKTLLDCVIYGASGQAVSSFRHAALGDGEGNIFNIVAFIDDFRGDEGEIIRGVPVISFDTWARTLLSVPCLVSVGEPAARKMLATRIREAGGCFVSFKVPETMLGQGSYMVAPYYLAAEVVIGDHVLVMPMTVIGHDVRIGDYVTISPSVTLSGHVQVGEGAFIGAGAVVINGTATRPLMIGAGAFVAAGAVVTKSVPAGAKVAGNPARSLRDLASTRRRVR